MVGDKELLSYLCENSDMGIKALESLDKNLEKTDNKIRSHVLKSLSMYRTYYKKCEKALKSMKVKPAKGSIMASFMTKMGTDMEFKKDNSDSKIADTLIQGYTMGINDITKKINRYRFDVSHSIIKLAEEYKNMMERGIKDVKGFL